MNALNNMATSITAIAAEIASVNSPKKEVKAVRAKENIQAAITVL
jgi:hypothetical protein